MSVRAIVAIMVAVALPIAVQGAELQQKQTTPRAKRVCTATPEIGSRLSAVRRCETRAERDARRREARYAVERIQNGRETSRGDVELNSRGGAPF